jgi:hypothetical protein
MLLVLSSEQPLMVPPVIATADAACAAIVPSVTALETT